MSELNQNNRRLSRLAIISQHVAAHTREHFGTVWGDFWRIGSFFLGTCLFRLNATLHRTLSFPFRAVYALWKSTMLCWFRCVFDANGGCSGPWWAPNVALKMLIAFDRWWGLSVPGNSADGRCPAWPTPRCVWAPVYCYKKHSKMTIWCKWLRIRS